jgi:hypothetical protein
MGGIHATIFPDEPLRMGADQHSPNTLFPSSKVERLRKMLNRTIINRPSRAELGNRNARSEQMRLPPSPVLQGVRPPSRCMLTHGCDKVLDVPMGVLLSAVPRIWMVWG